MKQLLLPLLIWTISHRQIYPRFLVYNAFVMSKGIKACFSMIASHATLSEAAKRHLACCQMNQRVIDTTTAKSDFFNYIFCCALILCKNLKCQWMCHTANCINCLINKVICQNRKNWSKDFLLHDQICKCHMIHYGRLNL